MFKPPVPLFTFAPARDGASARPRFDAGDKAGAAWWQHAVFYEVYPRSFMDSNGDGIGDLNGLTSRLDYLQWLGVDAVWITPFFPSPQVDVGYDITDYLSIDPVYGTLEDFDRLIAEAGRRHIRILLDFVLNHTSDQHPWFLDSRASRTAEKRDWYIWRDGKGPGQPPNNWIAKFGGSAWQFDEATQQYYYHYFYPQQPDLNWRHPAVRDAMFEVPRFWYERGVAGFRLDAVATLFEDPRLTDNPILPGVNATGDPNHRDEFNTMQPEIHDVLRDLRRQADAHQAVLIGETWTNDVAELQRYYGEQHDELQMPMDLLFTQVSTLSADQFRQHIAEVDAAGGWPVYVVSNHDIVRSCTRYADGVHDERMVKALAALYLTLRGTPILYYGEEIGMRNHDPARLEDVCDPMGRRNWPVEKGRDGERTPMQWAVGEHAGFTTGRPWLPVRPDYRACNVQVERNDPDSILNFYQRLLALRRRHRALLDGDWIPVNEDNSSVLMYLRRDRDQAVLVALNFSAETRTVSVDPAPLKLATHEARTLIATCAAASTVNLSAINLPPYTIYIGDVSSPARRAR